MDQAWGYVNEVLDGDTFVMLITSVSRHNEFELARVEHVRLRRKNAPELTARSGRAARERLRRLVAGRRVRIDIFARDIYGRPLANLSTSP